MTPHADLTIVDATASPEGIRGVLKTFRGDITFYTPLLGRFNLHNIMAAVGAALCLDVSLEHIQSGLEEVGTIPGRMEKAGKAVGFTVLVDYAHTPDALEQVLTSLKELSPKRIIAVFGCGGDRDTSKRPIMGKIAGLLSEIVIITSDNPRTEKPEQIISEIEEGAKDAGLKELDPSAGHQERGYLTVLNRREAIQTAIRMAQRDDIVLVAGKGHEDYQILREETITFDDRKEVETALQEKLTR
jgi:UDP-N-acetylmuramoyl-L-alanyl-D-glutamate--2,6-diaminopimelate ligase